MDVKMFEHISYVFSEKAQLFIEQNQDLSLLTDDEIFIRIEDNHGHLSIALSFDPGMPNLTMALRCAAPLVNEWNVRLLKFQGLRQNFPYDNIKELLDMKRNGKTYREIAETFNQKIGNCLKEYFAFRTEIDQRHPEYKKELDSYFYLQLDSPYLENLHHDDSGLVRSRLILKDFGLSDSEIECQLRDGLNQIKAGKNPFVANAPITKEKVSDILKYWRSRERHVEVSS